MSAEHTATRHGGHIQDRRLASRRSLLIALAMIAGFAVVEVIGGLLSGSLALLADAGHMITDAAAIGVALLAMWLSTRPATSDRSFGFHRSEILAALANALSLWLIAGWVFLEAYHRFWERPEVHGGPMLVVGIAGLAVNIAAAWVLMRASGESLNVEGALMHVMGDLAGSVAVIAAAILVTTMGWYVADPVFGILIAVLIVVGSGRLLWKVTHVLMEGTPASLDLQELCRRIEQVDGVQGVHDIHAWTITSGYEVLSAHVTLDGSRKGDPETLLQELRDIAATEFGITHTTIQIEESRLDCEESHHVEHTEETTTPAGTAGNSTRR